MLWLSPPPTVMCLYQCLLLPDDNALLSCTSLPGRRWACTCALVYVLVPPDDSVLDHAMQCSSSPMMILKVRKICSRIVSCSKRHGLLDYSN